MKTTKDKMPQYLLSTFDEYLRAQEQGLDNISVAELKLIATRVDWPRGWCIHNTYEETMQMDRDVITSYHPLDPEEKYMKGDAYKWIVDNQDNLVLVELNSLHTFKYNLPRRHREVFKSFVEITKHTDDWWWVVIHFEPGEFSEEGETFNVYKCDQMSGMLSLLDREMPGLKKRLNNL
jgi:hypothetical protein